jgi:hypothetical protein
MTKKKSISTPCLTPKTTSRSSAYAGQRRVKRLHVNQHNIRANIKDDVDRPIFTCKASGNNYYGHEVDIHGPSTLVYPDKPLSCGARVWIETVSPVTIRTYTGDDTEEWTVP